MNRTAPPIFTTHRRATFALLAACGLLTACGTGGTASSDLPGDPGSHKPFAGITDGDTVRMTGTEPFWGATLQGTELTYTTPDNPAGDKITVSRFAGRGGLGISGATGGKTLDLTITQSECSDGMSDRTYPYTVTLGIGDDFRQGCAWTDRQPFTGQEHP